MVFTEIGIALRDGGLGVAIIQKKHVSELHLSTSFYIFVLMGLVFWGISVVSAPLISTFFHNEALRFIIPVISLRFIFYPFGLIQEISLNKQLLFKKLAFAEIGETLSYGLIAVLLALNGFAVWSLVCGSLGSNFVKVVLLRRLYTYKLIPEFSIKAFRELFGFARHWLGFKVVSSVSGNLDRFLIGKFLGTTQVGFYSLAYTLANFPRLKLTPMIFRVTFPAFSIIQDDLEILRKGYLKIVSYTSIMTFPLLGGLLIISPYFVPLVYSSKWTPMVFPLQILCVAGMIFSISGLGGSVVLSMGRSDIFFKLSLLGLLGIGSAVVLGIKAGLVGIAIGISIYAFFINIIVQLIMKRLIKVNVRDYLYALRPAAVSSGVMLLGLTGFSRLQSAAFDFSDIFLMVTLVLLGAFLYFLSLFLTKREILKEVLELCRMSK